MKNINLILLLFLITISVNNAQSVITGKINASEIINNERIFEINILENNSKILSFEKKINKYKSIPTLEILSNNNFSLIYSGEGVLEFYSSTGDSINTIKLYEFAPFEEQKLFFDSRDELNYVAISENFVNKIHTIDNYGNIISTTKIEEGQLQSFVVDQQANVFATSFIRWDINNILPQTLFLNSDFEEISKVNFGFKSAKFSDDKFLGFSNKEIFLFDLQKRTLINNFKISDQEIILDANFDGNKVIFVSAVEPKLSNGEWIYNSGEIKGLSYSKEIVLLKSIKEEFKKVDLSSYFKNKEILLDGKVIEIN